MNSYIETSWNDHATKIAWPLAIIDRERKTQLGGTAVIVAPSYALTARHIFEHAWHQQHGRHMLPNDPNPDNVFGPRSIEGLEQIMNLSANFSILTFQVIDAERKSCLLWHVDKMWLSPLADIALIHLNRPGALEPAEFRIHHYPEIDFRTPSEGEPLECFGYPEPGTSSNINEIDSAWVECRPVRCHGKVLPATSSPVTEAHFSTNMNVESGQSGGPVFDRKGNLVGIITGKRRHDPKTGFPTNAESLSQCAPIWPILSMLVEVDGQNQRCIGLAKKMFNAPQLHSLTYNFTLEQMLLDENKKHFGRNNILNHLSIAADHLALGCAYHDAGYYEHAEEQFYLALDIAWSESTEDHRRIADLCVVYIDDLERILNPTM
jgi:hypothetical protein